MINSQKKSISNLNEQEIDKIYKNLLDNKWQFVILDINGYFKDVN